jgi:Tfp pilus assembly protein PilF
VALLAVGASAASFAGSRAAQAASSEALLGRADLAAAQYGTASRIAPWRDDFAVARAEQAEVWAKKDGSVPALRTAEASYRRAIAINGSDPVTRQELARLYLAHPEVWGDAGARSALGELQTALAQNPYYSEMQNDLGVAFLRVENREEARRAFGRAALGRREFVDPLLNLAALAMESGDPVEARSWLTRALERDPGSARARALLARLSQ